MEGNTVIPEITTERGAELDQTQNAAAAIDQAVMDSAEAFKALGQIEGLDFLRHVADVAAAQTFEKIKKNKSYKNLPYTDASGNRRHVADLDEFCQVFLGKSARRVRELAQNLHVLGSDLYESAERLGFRSRDYRALKALPEDQQAIVKQALEAETKDEVLNVLTDLTEQYNAERAAAKKEKEDLTADLEARSKLLADKAERLGKTEEELYRLKSLPPDADLELKLAREAEAVKSLENGYMSALVELNKFLVQVETVLGTNGISAHTAQHAVYTVEAWCGAINAALLKHNIPVNFEEMVSPEWMRDTAKTDLEAGNTDAGMRM